MKPFSSLIVTVLVAAIAGAAGAKFMTQSDQGASTPHKESAYEQVIKTNTLRCAYWVYPPTTSINPQTGKIEGFAISVVEEMAKRMGLKVEWVEEVTFGNMLVGLETHRFDAVCPGAFITGGRGRHAEMTVPFVYNGIVPVVRADDIRFDKDVSVVNDPSMVLSVMDGDITAELVAQTFPKARVLSISQNGIFAEGYLNLTSKKADMFFSEVGDIRLYMEKNPGQVKMLNVDKPLRISPWAVLVNKGEHELIGLFNAGLTEMLYDGTIERIAKKFEPITKGYYYLKPSLKNGS